MAREPGRASRRVNQTVSKLTDRVDRHKTPLGLLVLAIGAFLALIGFVSTTGPPFQSKYQIEVGVPADAPVLRKGQAVRIGGRLAGLISEVTPDRENGGTTVSANITKTNFRPLPKDTEANVRVHSIVYETYLELYPGDSDEELENGDTLKAPASSGVDLLEVVQLFDKQTRESLRETVVNLGFGAAGRGVEVNQALKDLPPLSRDFSAQIRAATREKGALGNAIAGAAGFSRGLRGVRDDDVEALIESADASFGAIAGRREELGEAIELLRPFEDRFLEVAPIAEPLLDDLAALSTDLEPAVRSLNAQLPSVSRLFDLGETLSTETGRISDAADPVLRTARPVIFGLFPTMTALGPLNADLAKLLATIEPFQDEISEAGVQFSDATGVPFEAGLASGAPAARVVGVLVPHTCQNPIPEPGEAQTDSCPEER